jgi:UDP-2,3-diacylglucosamine pyrophosphatase LpxH
VTAVADEIIYFISDTHLGDGTGADRFRFPAQLMGLLARIEAEPRAHLVLLGDFMELWATGLEGCLVRHAATFGRLGAIANTHPVTYVVGNHDCLPWYYFIDQGAGRIRVAERFTAARGGLVALHGHQFDPFNKVKITEGHVKVPWIRRLVQAMGFLGRVGGQETGDLLADAGGALEQAASALETLLPAWDEDSRKSLRGLLRGTVDILSRESPGERGYPPGERTYQEAALGLMRSGARIVVMGHTHHPMMRRYGNRTYVNTGSWVSDKYPPTYARYAGGQIQLLEANTHQPYSPPEGEQQ